MSRYTYETPDPDPYPEAVQINGHSGIAWYVRGFQTEPDEDSEWTGIYPQTGRLVCTMIDDDAHWLFDPEDILPLRREDYCGECGQIGCSHDGYDRSE